MGEQITRRGVLKTGIAAGAVVGTGAWRATAANAAPLRQPGSLPFPKLAAGTDTIPQIEHIVVLMMENHSYDNYLGMLQRPGADGFKLKKGAPTATNPYPNGQVQHAFRMPTHCQLSSRPSQEWTASHNAYNNGRMNGFVSTPIDPLTTEIVGGVAMGYWQAADLPFYYSLYRQFPIADRYFCSLLGQTFPNRRYLLAATSIGMIDDTTPATTDYPANGTIFDQFDAHGITWKDYISSAVPTSSSLALFPELYLKNATTKIVLNTEFFTDAAAGTLPNYSLVEPDYENQSEENPQNIALGEEFAARVINAVMNGPAWDRTLLILTYDEHGGYYDHVPPPAAILPDSIGPALVSGENGFDGFGRYGFRVPFTIVSPWARKNFVSHRVYDHTSILKLIETKWNLPALTFRDANATAMLDMLDLHHPWFATPPKLAQPIAVADPSSLTCSTTGPGTIPPPGSVTGP
ncbi:MAG TPA: alkaline phosphatase family protein [Trebonia sp.]|nr:alkaline phosphatase family protein [Trebonia sp.]